MFQVFDCTKTYGTAWLTRSERLARIAAIILTKLTGRFHDYAVRYTWEG